MPAIVFKAMAVRFLIAGATITVNVATSGRHGMANVVVGPSRPVHLVVRNREAARRKALRRWTVLVADLNRQGDAADVDMSREQNIVPSAC